MSGARVALPRRLRPWSRPPTPAARRLPRARVRTLVIATATLVVVAAAGLWLRDSSLVAVEHVRVTGANGSDGPAIRRALSAAAREMTTLHVREGSLRDAVSAYPIVKDLRVSAHPLHGLSIAVIEHAPAAVLLAGDSRVAVAADGTVLRKVHLDGLPLVPTRGLPGGQRLRDRQALGAVVLAGFAPVGLRGLITRIRSGGRDGLRADMQGGLRIVFGSRTRLAAKWAAAARVLADPKAAGAAYLDVRVPERPVAGPFADPAGGVGAAGPGAQAGADTGQGPSTHAAGGRAADAGAAPDSSAATQLPSEAQSNP